MGVWEEEEEEAGCLRVRMCVVEGVGRVGTKLGLKAQNEVIDTSVCA